METVGAEGQAVGLGPGFGYGSGGYVCGLGSDWPGSVPTLCLFACCAGGLMFWGAANTGATALQPGPYTTDCGYGVLV